MLLDDSWWKRRRKRSANASPDKGKFKRSLFKNAFANIEDILSLDNESYAYDGDLPPDELDDIQSDDDIYDILGLNNNHGESID